MYVRGSDLSFELGTDLAERFSKYMESTYEKAVGRYHSIDGGHDMCKRVCAEFSGTYDNWPEGSSF